MATFKETREILLASYASNIITIEEYALLFEENSSNVTIMRCGDHLSIFTSGQLQSRPRCWILKSLIKVAHEA